MIRITYNPSGGLCLPDNRVEATVRDWISNGNLDITVSNFIIIVTLLAHITDADKLNNVELYYINAKNESVRVDDILFPPNELFDVSDVPIFKSLKDVV
jgi:hypothetical protein